MLFSSMRIDMLVLITFKEHVNYVDDINIIHKISTFENTRRLPTPEIEIYQILRQILVLVTIFLSCFKYRQTNKWSTNLKLKTVSMA